MAVTQRTPIHKTLYKSLLYITNEEKTDGKVLISGVNEISSDPRSAFVRMRYTKEKFNKKDKIQAHHFIQAFEPGEVSQETAHEIGMKWAKEIFGENFQGILATHIDKDHIHNHIIINSVSHVNGKKYDSNRGEYRKIREKSDRLCEEYGLSVIQETKNKKSKTKTKKEIYASKKMPTQKEIIKEDIKNIILISKDFDDFILKMKSLDYSVKYGKNRKNITFTNSKMTSFRGSTLGEDFTEEGIKNLIDKVNSIQIVNDKKNTNDEFDKNISNNNNTNVRKITINNKLIKRNSSNYYYTKIPYQKMNIFLDKKTTKRINVETIEATIYLDKEYEIETTTGKRIITGKQLMGYYDDATKAFEEKRGIQNVNRNSDTTFEERRGIQNTNRNIENNKQFSIYRDRSAIKPIKNPYGVKQRKFRIKNINIYNNFKNFAKKKLFKGIGIYYYNFNNRKSLLFLLALLRTKNNFQKKKFEPTQYVSSPNYKVLKRQINFTIYQLNYLQECGCKSLTEINEKIVESNKIKKNFRTEISKIEENILKKGLIYVSIKDYIRTKPAYKQFMKDGKRNKDVDTLIETYNFLKNMGIDNEVKIVEFYQNYDIDIEDLNNDIEDIKLKIKNLEKENFKLEKLKESITEFKKDLDLDKNIQQDNLYK